MPQTYDNQSIEVFAARQLSSRLGRLVFEIRRASRKNDADTIHDLRVAIRRFTQALRVFSNLVPGKQSRRIRKRLRQVMDLAGEVRNQDIALELLRQLGLPGDSPLAESFSRRRQAAHKELKDCLRGFDRSKFSSNWRGGLHLEGG